MEYFRKTGTVSVRRSSHHHQYNRGDSNRDEAYFNPKSGVTGFKTVHNVTFWVVPQVIINGGFKYGCGS